MLKQIVVRYGSFTEAAEECDISQSAISQQIQALKQELGVQLLECGNRKFSLTPAGEHFYEKSLIFTADFNRAVIETIRIAHRENPQLHLGCLKGYSGREFQQAVAEFAEQHPKVSIHVINGTHEELYEELFSCRVDAVLSDQRRAFSDEYANHILARRQRYTEIAARNQSLQSSAETQLRAKGIASSSASRERTRSFLKIAFTLDQSFSIGFKSGLYGGK